MRKQKTVKRAISLLLTLVLTITTAHISGTDVKAASTSELLFEVYSDADPEPIVLDDSVTVPSGSDADVIYVDRYITNQSETTSDLGFKSDSNPTAFGALSMETNKLYYGTGSDKVNIGYVDSTLNGQNGLGYLIHFNNLIPNGNFDTSISGWEVKEEAYIMSGDTEIATESRFWLDLFYDDAEWEISHGQSFHAGTWISLEHMEDSLLLAEWQATLMDNDGMYHGPSAYGPTFSADKGDKISFDIINEGDLDVERLDHYIYLVDEVTGKEQLLHNQTTMDREWQRIEAEITLPSSDNFSLKIIYGTQASDIIHERFCGIDSIGVISKYVDESLMSEVARRITFTDDGQTKAVYPYDIMAATHGFYESWGYGIGTEYGNYSYMTTNRTLLSTVTVEVVGFPNTPVMEVTALSESSIQVDVDIEADASSNSKADNYNVYIREGDGDYTLIHDSVLPSVVDQFTIDELTNNTQYSVKVEGINKYGTSPAKTSSIYTFSKPPILSVDEPTYQPSQILITNNDNQRRTLYELERSTDGVTFDVISDALMSEGTENQMYDDLDAAANSTYYYRIRSYNNSNVPSDYSDVLVRQTGPDITEGIVITNADYDSHIQNITWDSVAGASHYIVLKDGVEVDDVTVTNLQVTGLVPNTEYTYVVRSGNDDGLSYDSESVSEYTHASIPTIEFYEGVTDTTTESIKFKILNHDNPADTTYIVERREDGGEFVLVSVLKNYEGFDKASQSYGTESDDYMDNGLQAGTEYGYRVKSINESGVESPYSEIVTRYTLPDSATLVDGIAKEGNVADEDLQDKINRSIILDYQAPKGAFYYDIYRIGPGEESVLNAKPLTIEPEGEYVQVGSNIQSTVFEDTIATEDFAYNQTYMYYVVARNSSGESIESMTTGVFSNAAVPVKVQSTNLPNNQVQLNVEDDVNPQDGITSYYIEYSIDGGTSWNPVLTENEGWQSYKEGTIYTVDPAEIYTFRVKARNADGVETAPSGVVIVRDNTEPVITILEPADVTYKSEQAGFNQFTIRGTVEDVNNDTVTITASLDGITKTIYVPADADGEEFSMTWSIDKESISEGDYGAIAVSGDDGFGGRVSVNTEHLVKVDLTSPNAPTSDASGSWTNAEEALVTLVTGTDNPGGVGASHVLYSLTGATTADWRTYNEPITITDQGVTTIVAVTVDAVGNVSDESNHTVKIDRVAPILESYTVHDTDKDIEGRTDVDTVTLKNITGSDDVNLYQMQVSQTDDFSLSLPTAYNTSMVAGIAGDEGSNSIYLRLIDTAGNYSNTEMVNVTKDSTAPLVTVSKPSEYSIGKGGIVTFTVSSNETGTFTMTADDITINGIGTVATNTSPLKDNMVIQQVDALTKKVIFTIPNDYEESGGFGITVGASVALDDLDNASASASSIGMCTIDTLAPLHQAGLLNESKIVKGGEVITLNMASTDYEGGEGSDPGAESDIVFLAPEGFSGEPANGSTITSTHGSSSMINAPLNEGVYYLYIMDVSGNLSARTLAAIGVDNEGPRITINGPDLVYAKAGDSSTYTIVYEDADTINLLPEHIALKTTGTANAYVNIINDNTVELNNLSGEGTIAIKVLEGAAVDGNGNESDATGLSELVYIDNTAPTIIDFSITSNNVESLDYVTNGHEVTIRIVTDEAIQLPTITFGGNNGLVSEVEGQENTYEMTYTLDGSEGYINDGYVDFRLNYRDLTGNEGVEKKAIDFEDRLTLDLENPEIQLVGDLQELIDTDRYDRVVTIKVVDDNDNTSGTYTYNGGEAIEFNEEVTVSQNGTYVINGQDLVGNASPTKTIIIDSLEHELTTELKGLSIVYTGANDYAESITEDLILRTEANNSSVAIEWSVDSGTGIAVDGTVTRPAFGQEDSDVVLRATVSKDGKSIHELHNLTVTAPLTDDEELEPYYENLSKARIVYAEGDSNLGVTDTIYLSVKGLSGGDPITWTSSDEGVIAVGETINLYWYETDLNRPSETDGDVEVTLTASVTIPEATNAEGAVIREEEVITKAFNLTVKAFGSSAFEKVKLDFDELTMTVQGDDYYDFERRYYVVTEDVVLSHVNGSTTGRGSTVTWSSTNADVVHVDGSVTIPGIDETYKYVVLTGTISQDGYTLSRTYDLKVMPDTLSDELADDYVSIGYFADNDADNVLTHVILPEESNQNNAVTWASDNELVISRDGLVVRGENDQVVTLTATIRDDASETKEMTFVLTVKGLSGDDFITRIDHDVTSLVPVFDSSNSHEAVTENIGLYTVGSAGCDIEWTSSHPEIISNTGAVTRDNEETLVTMTAYVNRETDGSAGETVETLFTAGKFKSFEMRVLGTGDVLVSEDTVEIEYAVGDNEDSVTDHLKLPGLSSNGNPVTWESNDTSVVKDSTAGNERGMVIRPSNNDREIVLIATITDSVSGQTTELLFNIVVKLSLDETIPEEEEDIKALTYDTAFIVTNDDYWESITGDFLALNTMFYGNGSAISWSSSDDDVLEMLTTNDEKPNYLDVKVNRQADDTPIILTATIQGDAKDYKKDFLLIVKGTEATESSIRVESVDFDVSLKATMDNSDTSEFKSQRTTILEGETPTEVVDVVSIDDDSVEDAILQAFNTTGDQNLTLDFYKDDMVEEDLIYNQGIELSAEAVESLGIQDVTMSVMTNMGEIVLSGELFRGLSETGSDLRLYFGEEKNGRIGQLQTMMDTLAGDVVSIYSDGISMVMNNPSALVNSTLILPFGDDVPEDLTGLGAYILHHDGQEEFVEGTVVIRNGNPYGVQITIDKTSEFVIVKLPEVSSSTSSSNGSTSETDESVNELRIPAGTVGSKEAVLDGVTIKAPAGFVKDNDETVLTLAKDGYDITLTVKDVVDNTISLRQRFDKAVQMSFEVSESEAKQITTAVLEHADGSRSHIPTYIKRDDEKYYVVINTFVLGDFTLIYNPVTFSDLDYHWVKVTADNMYQRTVVTSLEEDVFGPDQPITRAEYTKMIITALGYVPEDGEYNFKDVDYDSPYASYIYTSKVLSFVEGYDPLTFGPDDYLTREQSMTIIYRLFPLTDLLDVNVMSMKQEILAPYADKDQVSDYALEAMVATIYHGIVQGRGSDELAPGEYVTRAEAITLIERFLKKTELID